MFIRPVLLLLLGPIVLSAQGTAKPPRTSEPIKDAQPAQDPAPPKFDENVVVVGITPIHGLGLPRHKVPFSVQVFTAEDLGLSFGSAVPSLLLERGTSLHASETQGGAFQPDLWFRGYVGSPLLGASEGLAVYQDGVRVNEAFGDTVNWDALPGVAIANINLTSGSNPVFGLNALGGALSVTTKDGFSHPGHRVSVSTGSFGRHQIDASIAGHCDSIGYFVAGSLTDEAGWRDHSPSTLRRVFGDLAWRGAASSLNLKMTAASNDMVGNGAAPRELLEIDRAAVFTHPDRTENDFVLTTVKAHRGLSSSTMLEAVAYYRRSRIGTFNGDAADLDDADDFEMEEDETFGAVNNISATGGRSAGITSQLTLTAPLRGRANHFVVGTGIDAASTQFDFMSEWAHLTPDRGTIGTGLLDDESFVGLHSRTMTASVFATNTWSPTAALNVTLAARFNRTEVTLRDQIGTALNGKHRFGRINPGAGATFQLLPDVNLYGSYTQSSRVPTPVELTCADPEDPCRLPNAFVSDPPLDQIVARTWEAGARGSGAGAVHWSVSVFTSTAADDIIFVSSGTMRGEGHFENVASTRRRGVEASLRYQLGDRLAAFGTYTVQQATFGSDLRIASQFHPMAVDTEIAVPAGSRLPSLPTHSAKFGVSGFVTTGLKLGIDLRAQSSHYFRGDEANLLQQLPGFAILNARARQRITDSVAAVLEMQNIFDARYYTFGVLGEAELLGDSHSRNPRFYSPGAPRAAWVGLQVEF